MTVFVVFVWFVMDGDKSRCTAVKLMAWAVRTVIVVGGGVDGVGEKHKEELVAKPTSMASPPSS